MMRTLLDLVEDGEPSTVDHPVVGFVGAELGVVASRLILEPWWADLLRKLPTPLNQSLQAKFATLAEDSYTELQDIAPGIGEDWRVFVFVESSLPTVSVNVPKWNLEFRPVDGLTVGVPSGVDVTVDGAGWLLLFDENGWYAGLRTGN